MLAELLAFEMMVDGKSAWEDLWTWEQMDVIQYSDDIEVYIHVEWDIPS